MRGVFQKSLENDSADGPSTPLSPLTPTASPSLIPKPSGEVGRVGRGGYTLRDILEQQHRWEDGLYQKIRERASKEFPALLEYEGNWVVHDYLRIFLKNSAQKAKKDQQQKDKELEAKGKARGVGVNLIVDPRSQLTIEFQLRTSLMSPDIHVDMNICKR
ncbi:hypothetical protein EDB83DRAFT_2322411 [Lactarius deliciosus]|nr:hypothetical protein EDB83DRAFT_2322411 [Lactarius deliciosus]